MELWIQDVATMLMAARRNTELATTYTEAICAAVTAACLDQAAQLHQVLGSSVGGIIATSQLSGTVIATGDGSCALELTCLPGSMKAITKVRGQALRSQTYTIKPLTADENPEMGLLVDGTVRTPNDFVGLLLLSAVKLMSAQWPNDDIQTWATRA